MNQLKSKMASNQTEDKVKEKDKRDEINSYQEAFDTFDWNKDGTIPTGVTLHNTQLYLELILI